MLKQFICFILFSIAFSNIKAQEGKTVLSINAETTIPIFQNDRGLGFFLKGSYGISNSRQLTLSGGVSKFNSKNSIATEKVTTRLIPFLFGYKQNIRKFFVEPRIGLGELGGKILIDGDYSRPSVTAFFAGSGTGYSSKRINVGISFLTAHGIENTSAGIWHNKNFHYTGVYIGYDLFK